MDVSIGGGYPNFFNGRGVKTLVVELEFASGFMLYIAAETTLMIKCLFDWL